MAATIKGLMTWAFVLALGALPACGGDSDSSDGASKGGSCVSGSGTTKLCFTVTVPADYDVKTECGFTSGAYSAGGCDVSAYVQKCTQVTQVTENGKTTDVTYVYYYPAGTTLSCLGTLENL